ncbi:MAG: ABC transporter ATP-binding protein [Spirochaetota bacterium]|nr:MAG: ABC transporter ATP-binding protein [Spirochaetota bacterium]
MQKRDAIISMKGITKTFPGGLKANDNIDLDIYQGEIHAVLGENGAGKSTLMNILSGIYRADSGEFFLNCKPVQIKSPKEAISHGIIMVHQHFRLIPPHTVAENIVLGLGTSFLSPLKGIEKSIKEFNEQYNLSIHPKTRICDLSVGEQQRVEIVKALIRGASILILDEPTSVLTPQEAKELFGILEKMKKEGKAIIFITHKLEEVLEIADHITILRKGKVTASMPSDQIAKKGSEAKSELAMKMVGREVILKVEKESFSLGNTVLEVDNLKVLDDRGIEAVKGVSFSVNRGEVFGIVGVAGNGQGPLVEAITGLRPPSSGSFTVKGDVGYIPEDRLSMGSVGDLTLAENSILTDYKNSCFSRHLLLNLSYIREYAEILMIKFSVVAPNVNTRAKQLSGGNLQRLILARELSKNTQLLVAEQPTHGLDVGSIEFVWKFLLEQRKNAGILLISGDLSEVLSLSDRIGVMFQGKVTIFESPFSDKIEEIGLKMTGF